MSSFYPHSNALSASVLLFSLLGNDLFSDNVPRLGTIFNPNKLDSNLLSNKPSDAGLVQGADLVLEEAYCGESLRLAGW